MHKVTLKETFPLSCQIFHYQPLVLCNFIWTHKTGAKKNAKAHWSRKKMSIISLIIWCNFSELMLMWAVFFPPVYSWVFCWTSCYSKSIHIQMYLILTGLDIIYNIQGCGLQKHFLLRYEFFRATESFSMHMHI